MPPTAAARSLPPAYLAALALIVVSSPVLALAGGLGWSLSLGGASFAVLMVLTTAILRGHLSFPYG